MMQRSLGSLKTCCLFATLFSAIITPVYAANPLEVLLEDFEDGTTAGSVPVDATNAFVAGASNSAVSNVLDQASLRMKITDPDGLVNGAVITIPGAIPGPGYYLITADTKIDNANQPITSFGMAAVVGGPATARIPDEQAGYVMNLSGMGDAQLGYQTIGAPVRAAVGLTYPQDVTLYFSTDPTGNSFNGPASDGDFAGGHRTNATCWTDPQSAVYVDNIKRIGPGNFGEERHLWISVGDGYTNLASLEAALVNAKNNNFNCVDILARYRADAYYVPNRNDATYANPEPFGTRVGTAAASASNDPLQYAIDRGHELGLKVYISFSCFLVTPNSTWPSTMDPSWIMWHYNNGAPRPMLTTDQGAEGLWADLGIKAVRDYTKNVLMDIVSNYDVDGVMFDRIRYPGRDYSYNPVSLAEMGYSTNPAPTSTAFQNARRKVVADFISECYQSVTTKKPWLVVGATPIAFGDTLNDAYNYMFQQYSLWSSQKSVNRTVGFGCIDCLQPQFYRLANATGANQAPAANMRLMKKAQYGDVLSWPGDVGVMPGAYTSVSPLLYHPNGADAGQSNANAQNITDARSIAMSGFGIFAATKTMQDIALIRKPTASTAGVDVLAAPAAPTDYLFKAGYEKIAPNSPTDFVAEPQPRGSVIFSWTEPAAASDGDPAAGYLIYKSATSPVSETYANLVTKTPVSGESTWFHAPVGCAGSYFYKIVAVDDYNNRSAAVQIGPYAINGSDPLPAEVIVDNPAAVLTGAWTTTSYSSDRYGPNYLTRSTGTGANFVTFTGNIEVAGNYAVSELHSQGTNRSPNTEHKIIHSGGTATVLVDQQKNGGGKWNVMGTYSFAAGPASTIITDKGTAGFSAIADAIKWSFVPPPNPAPAAPTNLQASPASISQINLTWQDNATDEVGYEIERTLRGGTTVLISNLPANTTSYSDSVLAEESEYTYVVRAYKTGVQSADSNLATARTLFQVPPDAIIDNPQAVFVGTWSIGTGTGKYGADYKSCSKNGNRTATYRNVPSRTAVYDLYEWHVSGTNRAGDAQHLVTTPAGTTTIVVNQQLNGAKFNKIGSFLLTAGQPAVVVINDKFSIGTTLMADAIKWVYVSEPPTTPAAPSGLVATVISDSEVSLAWMDNAINETSFEIERTKAGGAPQIIAAPAANSISFADSGLTALSTYTYSVRAVNSIGKSAASNAVTVTTLAATPADVIVDDASSTGFALTGAWTVGTSSGDKWASTYTWKSKGTGAAFASFTLKARDAGVYDVFEWHPKGTNRPTDAEHVITSKEGETVVKVNQQVNGGAWNKLGTFQFDKGSNCVVKITDNFTPVTGGVVQADAIKLVYVGELPPAPAAPASLVGSAVSQTQIGLTWQDVASDETKYQLVRTPEGGAAVVINLPANSNAYVDGGLTANSKYAYTVRALNGAIASADSNAVSVTTLPVPPAAPSDLVATPVSGSEVQLAWVDNAVNEDGYEVVLNGTVIAKLPAGATSYASVGLSECVEYTQTVRAYNAGGKSADSNAVKNTLDYTDPTIAAPADVQANADAGACAATGVVLGVPVTADNCGVADVTNDAPATYPVGTTEVKWTVTDAHGRTATAVQKVVVLDAENPTITAPADTEANNDAGQCSAAVVLGIPVTADNCGVANVTNDAPAAFPVGSTTVTWTVTDASGNSATATQVVVVKDAENPTITAPADTEANNDAGQCSASVVLGIPVTADNCGVANVTNDAPAAFPVGSTTVIWTVTDNAGNSASATQVVVVKDAEAPTITAPADVVVASDAGKCSASDVALGVPETADNCGVASTTNDAPAVFEKGETIVTWTVTDIYGNSSTATQKVVVEDRENPVITCPADITVPASIDKMVVVNWEAPVASDNCPGVTVECVPASGSQFAVGETVVTCTATDAAGNKSVCTFKVKREKLAFTGFLSPIGGSVEQGNGGSYTSPVRVYKSGSTIPVKMALACNGVPVTQGVHTLRAVKYDSAEVAGVAIDATPTDAATSGNAFRLADAAAGSWHYNLKTSGYSVGIWLLEATMSDGSKASVWIAVK